MSKKNQKPQSVVKPTSTGKGNPKKLIKDLETDEDVKGGADFNPGDTGD